MLYSTAFRGKYTYSELDFPIFCLILKFFLAEFGVFSSSPNNDNCGKGPFPTTQQNRSLDHAIKVVLIFDNN